MQVGDLFHSTSFDPLRHRFFAGFAHAGFVGVGTDNKQRVGMNPGGFQQRIEPGEHILEHYVGVRLAGIENDVREDRHQLLETGGFFEEFRFEFAHFGPELDPSHVEIAFETFTQVIIQALILCFVQLEVRGNIEIVSGGIAFGEVGAERTQPDFVADDADAVFARHPAGGCFGVLHAVKDHHSLGLSFLNQRFKLQSQRIGRADVVPEKRTGQFIVVQVMPAQDPAHGGQRKLTKRQPSIGEVA